MIKHESRIKLPFARTVRMTNKVSDPQVEEKYPPNGDPLVYIKFKRWQFFTAPGQTAEDEIILTVEDAGIIRDQLDKLGY